jgi:hypothetical protein
MITKVLAALGLIFIGAALPHSSDYASIYEASGISALKVLSAPRSRDCLTKMLTP